MVLAADRSVVVPADRSVVAQADRFARLAADRFARVAADHFAVARGIASRSCRRIASRCVREARCADAPSDRPAELRARDVRRVFVHWEAEPDDGAPPIRSRSDRLGGRRRIGRRARSADLRPRGLAGEPLPTPTMGLASTPGGMVLAAADPVCARTAARSITPRCVTRSRRGGRQNCCLVGGVDGVATRGAGLSSTKDSTGVPGWGTATVAAKAGFASGTGGRRPARVPLGDHHRGRGERFRGNDRRRGCGRRRRDGLIMTQRDTRKGP